MDFFSPFLSPSSHAATRRGCLSMSPALHHRHHHHTILTTTTIYTTNSFLGWRWIWTVIIIGNHQQPTVDLMVTVIVTLLYLLTIFCLSCKIVSPLDTTSLYQLTVSCVVNFTLWHPSTWLYVHLILCSCACVCLMISTIHFSMDYFFLFVPSMVLKPFPLHTFPLDNFFFLFSFAAAVVVVSSDILEILSWPIDVAHVGLRWWWYLASVTVCVCSHTHLTTIEQQQWTNNGNNFVVQPDDNSIMCLCVRVTLYV